MFYPFAQVRLSGQWSGSPVLLGSSVKPVLGLFLFVLFSVELLKVNFLKDYSGSGTDISSVLLPHSPRLCNITNGSRALWKKQAAGFVAGKGSRLLLLSNMGMSRKLHCPYAQHMLTKVLLLKWAYATKIW